MIQKIVMVLLIINVIIGFVGYHSMKESDKRMDKIAVAQGYTEGYRHGHYDGWYASYEYFKEKK